MRQRRSLLVPYNVFFAVAMLTMLYINNSIGEKNKYYSVKSLCRRDGVLNFLRQTDGAVVEANNETNVDCVFIFHTQSILQSFIVRFDFLQLSCENHLYVYDGAHPVGLHVADLTCTNSNKTIKTIYTRTNFVTFRYIANSWADKSDDGFKVVITAVKNATRHRCTEFLCKEPKFCISKDLVSDGISHCEDNSDETQQNSTRTITKTLGRVLFLKFEHYLIEKLHDTDQFFFS